jgi:hypothetical protein
MALPGKPPLETVAPSDTFSQWADKCNAIIDDLNDSVFLTPEGVVTVSTTQAISGTKTFNGPVVAAESLTSSGGFESVGTKAFTVKNTSTRIESQTFDVVGSAGVIFKSTAEDVTGPRLHPVADPGDDTLVFDTSMPGGIGGTLRVSSGNTLHLEGPNPTLKVDDSTWTLPSSSSTPAGNLVLSGFGSGGSVEVNWQTQTELADVLAPAVSDAIANQGLTLLAEVVPVGTIITAENNILTGWPAGFLKDTRYPGWIPMKGQTITSTQDSGEYNDLVKFLGGPGATTTTLKNYSDGQVPFPTQSTPGQTDVTYLIKYKKDPVTSFSLTSGSGVKLEKGSTTVSSIGIEGGTISLKTDSNDFEYSSGALKLKGTTAEATPNTLAKRDSAGRLKAVAPAVSGDVATKGYVDALVSGTPGPVASLCEKMSNGCYYMDSDGEPGQLSLVDREARGRYWGPNTSFKSSGAPVTSTMTGISNNPISSLTGQPANVRRVFQTGSAIYQIDENDIIYVSGDPNTSTSKTAVLAFTTGSTTVKYDSHTGSAWTSTSPSITIKTKDEAVRGTYISTGLDRFGALGRGVSSGGTYLATPVPSGPPSSIASLTSGGLAAQSLWIALGNTVRQNGATPFVLPSATSFNSALTGQSYIKKFVRTRTNTYAIVGVSGTEAQNELWTSGLNDDGQLGQSDTVNKNLHLPAVESQTSTLGTIALASPSNSNTIFKMADGSDHGLQDFSRVQIPGADTLWYIVVTGGVNNENPAKNFRLYKPSSFAKAIEGYVNGTAATTDLKAVAISGSNSIGWLARARSRGWIDVVSNSWNKDDHQDFTGANVTAIGVRNTGTGSSLDHKLSYVLGWGYNVNGEAGATPSSVRSSVPVTTRSEAPAQDSSTPIRLAIPEYGRNSYMIQAGKLYVAGTRIDGTTGVGLTGSQAWTEVTGTGTVSDMFVLNSSGSGVSTTSSELNNGSRSPAVFVIGTQSGNTVLFAAGRNTNGRLGTHESFNDETSSYLRIPFPEDPSRIVSIQGTSSSMFALCKDTPQSPDGRIYSSAGGNFVNWGKEVL